MKPESIRLKSILWPKSILLLATLAMLAFATCAQARITCTPSAATFTTAYPLTGGALNITAGSFTVACTTTNAALRTATYQVSAGLGSHSAGALRYAKLTTGASTLNYNLTSNIGCSTTWNTVALIPTPAYTTPSLSTTGVRTDTHTFYFWGCIPAGLKVPAAGTYTDSVITTVSGSASAGSFTGNASTISVSITAPASCSISTAPGPVAFSYTSHQAATSSASTTFQTTCTLDLPYNLSLDAGGVGYTGVWASPTGTYTDTASTLIYTLTLPAAVTGTGSAQTYTMTGSMAAGQGGKCTVLGGCTFTDAHTLTVTF